ncbi:hypothetical protein BH23ACI1_BH23ACI1_28800 [soil metagenome]
MRWSVSGRLVGLCAAAALSVAACATAGGSTPPQDSGASAGGDSEQQVNRQAKAMAAFQERIQEYMALHHQLEATLAPLPTEATPEQINKHQLALAQSIRKARRTAQPGDLFNPDVRAVIRTLMGHVFSGPDGSQLKAAVMDENPGRLRIGINDRYPDTVPLSTVPPQVLAGLPKLPPELEYRFIGRALILFDSHAHIIVDIMENAIP